MLLPVHNGLFPVEEPKKLNRLSAVLYTLIGWVDSLTVYQVLQISIRFSLRTIYFLSLNVLACISRYVCVCNILRTQYQNLCYKPIFVPERKSKRNAKKIQNGIRAVLFRFAHEIPAYPHKKGAKNIYSHHHCVALRFVCRLFLRRCLYVKSLQTFIFEHGTHYLCKIVKYV